MIAEDNPTFAALLARTLIRDGYDVVVVHDGEALVREVERAAFDADGPFALVVTDIRMPKTSGLEALEILRKVDPRATPVIVLTAFGDPAVHDEAHRLGALAVIDKPFELDDLRTAVYYFAHSSP